MKPDRGSDDGTRQVVRAPSEDAKPAEGEREGPAQGEQVVQAPSDDAADTDLRTLLSSDVRENRKKAVERVAKAWGKSLVRHARKEGAPDPPSVVAQVYADVLAGKKPYPPKKNLAREAWPSPKAFFKNKVTAVAKNQRKVDERYVYQSDEPGRPNMPSGPFPGQERAMTQRGVRSAVASVLRKLSSKSRVEAEPLIQKLAEGTPLPKRADAWYSNLLRNLRRRLRGLR